MKGTANHYPQEQLDWLRDHRAIMTRANLTKQFNARFGTTYKIGTLQGVCTRHRFMAGSTGQYKKGNVPYNAGKAGLLPFKPNSGQFGAIDNQNSFKNKLPVGTVAVAKDGFLKLKIAEPNQWMPLHRHIWETANRSIPPKHVLRFIDGDRQNCVLENLECLPKAISLLLNRSDYQHQHDTLKPVIKASCFLRNAISAKTREHTL